MDKNAVVMEVVDKKHELFLSEEDGMVRRHGPGDGERGESGDRAAEERVEVLHSPAYSENRYSSCYGSIYQRRLRRVALFLQLIVMRLLIIPRGEGASSGEYKQRAGDVVKHLFRRAAEVGCRNGAQVQFFKVFDIGGFQDVQRNAVGVGRLSACDQCVHRYHLRFVLFLRRFISV